MVPRENKNNAYAKFGGQRKSIMVFSELAYRELTYPLSTSYRAQQTGNTFFRNQPAPPPSKKKEEKKTKTKMVVECYVTSPPLKVLLLVPKEALM